MASLADIGAGICPNADRLLRWALDVDPPTVLAAEISSVALVRVDEALRVVVANRTMPIDRREAALGGLVALTHPQARGTVHGARSLAWAAAVFLREFQVGVIEGSLIGTTTVNFSLAQYPLSWLPPEAAWTEWPLEPTLEVSAAQAFGLTSGRRWPVLDPDQLRAPHPDIDRVLDRPHLLRALPDERMNIRGAQEAWKACPLAEPKNVEWLATIIAESVDDHRSLSAGQSGGTETRGMLDRLAAWVEAQSAPFNTEDVLGAYHAGRIPDDLDAEARDKAAARVLSDLRNRRGLLIRSMKDARTQGAPALAAKGWQFIGRKPAV